jgi:phosphoribosylaminoimidazolecarboxamide formyltransferase/IMP cyclohydrolase
MLRGAAKNHADVTVVVDPGDYADLLDEMLEHGGGTRFAFRARLAAKAFRAHRLLRLAGGRLPRAPACRRGRRVSRRAAGWARRASQMLRYGENPHQGAAFYRGPRAAPDSIAGARFAQGKELSFNNIADADTALECVRQFDRAACVIVKHANPCGVAVAADIGTAYELAYRTDPTSAFGGIIAFNRPLDVATARPSSSQQFVEVIVAPSLLPGAAEALADKPAVRVLLTGELARTAQPEREMRSVGGGVLVQDRDIGRVDVAELTCVTRRRPSAQEQRDLAFAWAVCHYVKSNAIVFARDRSDGGRGRGADEPRVLQRASAPSRPRKRACRAGRGHGLRCILSFPRWRRGGGPPGRHRRHPARRLQARRGSDRRR